MLPLSTLPSSDATASPRTVVRRKPTTRYHHGGLEHALRELARREITRHGSAQLSVRSLARSLGVSHAAAYRHFADRDTLLADIAARAMEQFADVLERAEGPEAAAARTPIDALVALADAYVRFAVERPNEFRLMFSRETSSAPAGTLMRRANDRASAPVVRQVRRLLSARGASPRHVASEAPELATQLWSLIHGATTLLLERQLEAGVLSTAPAAGKGTVDAALEMVIRGMHRMLGTQAAAD